QRDFVERSDGDDASDELLEHASMPTLRELEHCRVGQPAIAEKAANAPQHDPKRKPALGRRSGVSAAVTPLCSCPASRPSHTLASAQRRPPATTASAARGSVRRSSSHIAVLECARRESCPTGPLRAETGGRSRTRRPEARARLALAE